MVPRRSDGLDHGCACSALLGGEKTVHPHVEVPETVVALVLLEWKDTGGERIEEQGIPSGWQVVRINRDAA